MEGKRGKRSGGEEGGGGGEGRRKGEEEERGREEEEGGEGSGGKGRSGEGKEGGGDGRRRRKGRRSKRWSTSSNITAQKHISKCCSPSTAPQAWPVSSVSVPAALLLPPLHCTGSGEVEGMTWEDRERGRRKEG